MIILSAIHEVLRARLSAAVTTTEPSFAFAWGDSANTPKLGNKSGAMNGTTNVDLVGAPSQGTNRVIRSGFIYNADSADVTVIVEHYDGTNARQLVGITVPSGYTLTFGDNGWRVTNDKGAEVTDAGSVAATVDAITTDLGDFLMTDKYDRILT